MALAPSTNIINLRQPGYRRLRSILTERTRPIVLWCGAGLSISAGLPDWQGLKTKLLSDLEEKAFSFMEPERGKLLKRATAIDEEKNSWLAFTQLQQALGPTSFKEGVREHLSVPKNAEVPSQYLGFWRIGVRGMINLNLDRLATRAYSEQRSATLVEISGKSISAGPNVVGSGNDFILNLHGILEDTESWIITHRDLKELQNRTAYRTTLTAVFTNHAVLFTGISADDIAAGGFLASFADAGVDVGGHFWLTSRDDPDTDHWAESAGLQIIRYSATEGHESAFNVLFDDIATFLPEDEEAPAIRSKIVSENDTISGSEELASLSPEVIRRQIASYARHILDQSNEPIPATYRDFVTEYARPIYNAWYVSLASPDNKFFGYELGESLGEGAFANVYKATAPDGSPCAIKLMRQDLARDDAMLSCFRRGINSMRILERHRLDGMVRLLDAVELPAAIFMEYVDGPTLEQAVESHLVEPWGNGLGILLQVTKIIRASHRLPERVLHRDLRPSNIMLRGFYNSAVSSEVVVLDFDLSWHRGAYEISLNHHAQAALGYLAPEQILHDANVSTRNAAVDSYGLSAMIYYVFTREHPHQGIFHSAGFQEDFRRKCIPPMGSAPASVGNRLRRVVTAGVSWRQSERPDLGEIERELELLNAAQSDIGTVNSSDFWAEELLCQVRGETGYQYDTERQEYVARLVSGITIRLTPDIVKNSVVLHIDYAARGDEDRRNVRKFLDARIPEAVKLLKSAGFDLSKWSHKDWALSYSISATIQVRELASMPSTISQTLTKAIDRLSLQ